MKFFLGAHHPHWFGRADIDVPLFVSRISLENRRTLPVSTHEWALDSGAFTEIARHGEYRLSTDKYVQLVARFSREIGRMEWAAAMDWMCEPWVLDQTGLTVKEHQKRTVMNYVELKMKDNSLPWMPTLQGYSIDDYWRCVDLYDRAGVDLKSLPVVGLGSVCRRQATEGIAPMIREMQRDGLSLHGFGFKIQGLLVSGNALTSSDSMAWSFSARRSKILMSECAIEGKHKTCANCPRYALEWRQKVLGTIAVSMDSSPMQAEFSFYRDHGTKEIAT